MRVYKIYFNPEKQVAVVEYIVEGEHGQASVKLISGDNPWETLREYYLHEEVEDT